MNDSDYVETIVGTGFVKAYNCLPKIMDLDEAYFMSFLLDLHSYLWQDKADEELGWMLLSREFLLEKLGIAKGIQERLLAKLKVRNLIYVSRRGNPSKRYVKINFATLKQEIQKEESGVSVARQELSNTTSSRPEIEVTSRPVSGPTLCNTQNTIHPDSSVAGATLRTGEENQERNMTNKSTTKAPPPLRSGGLLEGFSTPTKLSHFDMRMAERLRLLAMKHRPGLKWKKSSWADQVRLLTDDLGGDTDRIENVLDWLGSQQEKKIRVTSAQWFRRNFVWLEEATQRSSSRKPIAVDETSPELKKIMRRIASLVWVDITSEDVTRFASACLVRYSEMLTKLKTVHKNREDYPKLKGLIHHVYSRLSLPVEFVVDWIIQTHTMVQNWRDWSGTLKGLEFSPSGKIFGKRMAEICGQYSSASKWSSILELIG